MPNVKQNRNQKLDEFSKNVTLLAPLEIHSKPNEPDPENRSSTFEFCISNLIFFGI